MIDRDQRPEGLHASAEAETRAPRRRSTRAAREPRPRQSEPRRVSPLVAFQFVVVCALLVFGVSALWRGPLSEAPFNLDARVTGPDGKLFWGPDLTTMMNAAEYRLAAGRAFLAAAAEREGDARRDALIRAQTLLAEAAALRPREPLARLDLAVVSLELREPRAAVELVLEAARLAPFNPTQAADRVAITWRLRALGDERVFDLLAADLGFLRRRSPGVFARLLRVDPRLELFVQQRLPAVEPAVSGGRSR